MRVCVHLAIAYVRWGMGVCVCGGGEKRSWVRGGGEKRSEDRGSKEGGLRHAPYVPPTLLLLAHMQASSLPQLRRSSRMFVGLPQVEQLQLDGPHSSR